MYDTVSDNVIARAVVKSGEVLEPLGGGYGIIQPESGYRFGTDAVTLARFAASNIERGARVVDMCSGCGIVGLLLCAEHGAQAVGAEIDVELCDMSNRSAAANGLNARFINTDLRTGDIYATVGRRAFGCAVCNPPFFKADSKPRNIAAQANSELTIDFERIADVAENMLTVGGKFFFIHSLSRLDELICTCTAHSLRVKKLVIGKSGKTFTAMCVLGGKAGVTVEVR